ncbi:hypothetical protein CLHOM_09550 [Clostridium homopropionicum DSM 5847]|uniref:Uncharacterized protein n=1 Tax=Clostridium homopropionicum DSM 5847 TaxID=1121318 RepID=A0A0L6ZCZ2_9CLOT|nr:hypothetical protein [Clostridium homopropionicum]KOA20812.1 hypothetical protein CLHOM_09550 [Clostridium homopropionicum DSM 5847]SFF88508.1 hypothetical protein SAMN04488501_10342 [Clostridium homopropionicum]
MERVLLEKIKEGDSDAFEQLYGNYAEYALRVALTVTRDKMSAADAVLVDDFTETSIQGYMSEEDDYSFEEYENLYDAIAAAIAIVALANTQYGSAAVNKIKDVFAPNKIVEEKIEGIDEKKNVSLQEGSSKYIIYIDCLKNLK